MTVFIFQSFQVLSAFGCRILFVVSVCFFQIFYYIIFIRKDIAGKFRQVLNFTDTGLNLGGNIGKFGNIHIISRDPERIRQLVIQFFRQVAALHDIAEFSDRSDQFFNNIPVCRMRGTGACLLTDGACRHPPGNDADPFQLHCHGMHRQGRC